MIDTCVWKLMDDGDCYETSCDEAYCITEGTPKENNYNFCPNCGNKLVVEYEKPNHEGVY